MSNVSVYLIKDTFKIINRYTVINNTIHENKDSVFDRSVCLAEESNILQHLASLNIKPKKIRKADLDTIIYYRNRKEQQPEWKEFWGMKEGIFVRSADALVFLLIKNRIFAVCHGRSSGLLNPYAITANFGLITALNAVDPDKINSTDIFTPNETALQTRKKTSKSVKLSEYNLDIFSSLLKNVSGKARKEYEHISNSINGADSFKLSIGGNKEELITKISEIFEIYKLDTYKSNEFKWVDNFRPIKEKSKIDELDNKLLNAIVEKNCNMQLFIPTNLDYSGSYCYKFTGLGIRSNNLFNNLWPTKSLFTILKRTKKVFNEIEEFKNARIYIYSEDYLKYEKDSFSLYYCIYFEILDDKGWFFIESGNWYYVKEEFTKDFEEFYKELEADSLKIPLKYIKQALKRKYDKGKDKVCHYENWFNTELVLYLQGIQWKAELLDVENIHIKGYDKVEACDVISIDNYNHIYMFHNKYNSGSSVLSHLFSQANVASELLTKIEFRKLANDKIHINEIKFPTDMTYDARKYSIIIGIITKKNSDGTFNIPLFSKINLRIFVDRIQTKSYGLKLCFFEEE